MPNHDEYVENPHLYSPSPETKPEVNPSELPQTPKKSLSKKKTTASPSAKTSLVGSPSKDKAREMKRIALDALFEMGVRGEAANSIAAQVSPVRYLTQVRKKTLDLTIVHLLNGSACVSERTHPKASGRPLQDQSTKHALKGHGHLRFGRALKRNLGSSFYANLS